MSRRALRSVLSEDPAVTEVCVCVLIEASFLTGLLLSDWSGAHLWLSLAIQSESLMEAVVVEAVRKVMTSRCL